MKKKYAISFLTVAVLAVILAFTFDNKNMAKDNFEISNTQKESDHQIIEGCAFGYETLLELQKASPIIIKGTKVSSDPPVLLKVASGYVGGGYTISDFKIGEIIKNKSDTMLNIDDIIPIIENAFYDETTDTHYHINGYIKMIDGKDYLLLLEYAEGNEWYVPISATFGKVPLDTSEPLFYYDNMRSVQVRDDARLLKEARKKYE